MPDLNTILIGGFAIAPLVVALVALAKKLGLPVEYAPYLNGALSAALYAIAVYVLPTYPQLQPYVVGIATTVAIFFGASGIYKFGKVKK